MPTLSLKGVFPALVTPFDKEEKINEEALRKLVRYLLPNVDGFVPVGTTGEFVYMTHEERRRVLEIVIDEVKGQKPVIAGTGAASTQEAIILAKEAQKAGADACLVVTPYFIRPSEKGIFKHFYEIAKAVDIPIILYNIPQTTDHYLPRRVVEDLADIPNIVAMKDSSGNLAYMMEILEYCGDRIQVLVGHDEIVVGALAAGASGMILASANVYPEVWQEIYKAVQEGDLAKARELQFRVQKLSRIFTRYGGAVAVKAALNMMGIEVGNPRSPLKGVGGALVHEDRAEIRLELEKLGKIMPEEVTFHTSSVPLEERFKEIGIGPEDIKREGLRLGVGEAGDKLDKAKVELIAGNRHGIMGEAYAYQLTYPLPFREALTAILEPNLTVRPPTLIVPTVELRNLRQANMVYGPTQAAIARAIADSLEEKIIPPEAVDTDLIIALVTINPQALDRHKLYQSVYKAAKEAIKMAWRTQS